MFPFAKKWLCPFCCESFAPHEAYFRCTFSGCLGRIPDTPYSRVSGSKDVLRMGRVLIPGKKRMLPGMYCDSCKQLATLRICPRCHSELPQDIGQVDQYFFLLFGSKGSGKTHYLASLITQLQREVGPRMKMTVRPLGEPARLRWNKTYAPLFEQQKALAATKSAETDPLGQYPLSFRFTLEQRNGAKKTVNVGFFDTSGADFTSDSAVLKRYMHQVHGILFLIDPCSITTVRDMLGQQSSPTMTQATLEEYPLLLKDTFVSERILRPSEKVKIPVALTLTKMDLVWPHLYSGSPLLRPVTYSGGDIAKRLQSISTEVSSLLASWIGLQFTQTMRSEFHTYAYFGGSALGKPVEDPYKPVIANPLHVEDPLLWLLSQLHILKDTK
uniref:Uncharacterized protein n=1 Tax=Thermosporothrix sp. COM3 TaxID=2490863 RepID=A0A455SET9_9CHLR|nr:hypothetical protein KTC_17340 [Thermosporothrix sp. COM3]